MKKGVDTFGNLASAGIESGKEMGGTVGAVVAAPFAVAGGAVAGAAVATGKATKGIFGRGEPVIIRPEDTVTIDFGGAFNIPAE